MATLTVDTNELLGVSVRLRVTATVVDIDGRPLFTTYMGLPVLAQSTRTGFDGVAALDLAPNASIVSDEGATFWSVAVGSFAWLITKGTGTETVTEAAVYG